MDLRTAAKLLDAGVLTVTETHNLTRALTAARFMAYRRLSQSNSRDTYGDEVIELLRLKVDMLGKYCVLNGVFTRPLPAMLQAHNMFCHLRYPLPGHVNHNETVWGSCESPCNSSDNYGSGWGPAPLSRPRGKFIPAQYNWAVMFNDRKYHPTCGVKYLGELGYVFPEETAYAFINQPPRGYSEFDEFPLGRPGLPDLSGEFPRSPWETFHDYEERKLQFKLPSNKLLDLDQWNAIRGDVIPGTNALVEMTVKTVPRKIEELYKGGLDGEFGCRADGIPLTFFCNHARELHVMCETSNIFNKEGSIFHWPSSLLKADVVCASGPMKYLGGESFQTRVVRNGDAHITHIWVPVSYLIMKNRRFMGIKSNFGRMRGVSVRSIELLMKWKISTDMLGTALNGATYGIRFWSFLACY